MSQIQLSDENRRTGNGQPLLEVRNLEVVYSAQGLLRNKKGVRAVSEVSFDMHESEIFTLVGESGSGKTTLARCIAALTTAQSGSIRYRGIEISSLKGKSLLNYRREVQIIYQDPYASLNPREDVLTAISTPLRCLLNEKNRSSLIEKSSRLLKEVGIVPEEVLHKLPHQMSGGEKQRVNIARALAPNPTMLIADEPITMLDASQRLNILSLLKKLKLERSLTILFITHDLASAEFIGGRTAIIYSGKFVEIGPSERVLSNPSHPYTELILSATPKLTSEGETSGAYFEQEVENIYKSGCVFFNRCKYATELCKQVEPILSEDGGSHSVACHHKLS